MARGNGNDYHAQAAVTPGPSCFPKDSHALRRPYGPHAPALHGASMLSADALGLLYCGLAGAASAFSALAFYAASPHCRWPRLRRAGRLGRQLGLVAAATSLWLWMGQLGLATGFCVTLAGWMLTALALPYLAAWTRPDAEARR